MLIIIGKLMSHMFLYVYNSLFNMIKYNKFCQLVT